MRGADAAGPGERAERAKRNRLFWTVAPLMAAGAATGYAVALTETDGRFLQGSLPSWLAIALTAVYLGTVSFGSVVMMRTMDEHAIAKNIWAGAFGGGLLGFVYPAWLILWKGRLLPEPDHLAMFAILYVGFVLGCVLPRPRHLR